MESKTYDFQSLQITSGKFQSSTPNRQKSISLQEKVRNQSIHSPPKVGPATPANKEDPVSIINELFKNEQYKIIPKLNRKIFNLYDRQSVPKRLHTASVHQLSTLTFQSKTRPNKMRDSQLYSDSKIYDPSEEKIIGPIPTTKMLMEGTSYINKVSKMYETFMNIQKMRIITKFIGSNERNGAQDRRNYLNCISNIPEQSTLRPISERDPKRCLSRDSIKYDSN